MFNEKIHFTAGEALAFGQGAIYHRASGTFKRPNQVLPRNFDVICSGDYANNETGCEGLVDGVDQFPAPAGGVVYKQPIFMMTEDGADPAGTLTTTETGLFVGFARSAAAEGELFRLRIVREQLAVQHNAGDNLGTTVNGNTLGSPTLVDGSTNEIRFQFNIPRGIRFIDYPTPFFRFYYWTPATSGNARISIEIWHTRAGYVRGNDASAGSFALLVPAHATANMRQVWNQAMSEDAALLQGSCIHVKIERQGGHANDNMGGTLWIEVPTWIIL